MSSAALSASTSVTADYAPDIASTTVAVEETSRPRVERRRPDPQQGRALEVLGHAVEYLIDSRLYLTPGWDEANQEAVQILMSRSRAVFEECAALPERVPVSFRLGSKVGRWLCRKSFQRGWKG